MMESAILVVLGLVFMVVGFLLFFGGSKKQHQDNQELAHKGGFPILPRDQRQKPTIINDGDALSNLAAAVSTHEHQHHDGVVNGMQKATDGKSFQAFGQFDGVTSFGGNSANTNSFGHNNVSGGDFNTNGFHTTNFSSGVLSTSEQSEPIPSPSNQPNSMVFDSASLDMAVDESVSVYDDSMQDKLPKFDGQASALDQHFHEQEMEQGRNQKALLHNKETITLIIRPKDGRAVTGTAILRLAQDYAMKYGALKMFHRYEDEGGSGQLWFSMLGLSDDGIVDFDLVALPTQYFRGVALFLSLPHPQALRGFDSMVSVAQVIADDLEAEMLDEEGVVLETAQLQSIRNVVASYP